MYNVAHVTMISSKLKRIEIRNTIKYEAGIYNIPFLIEESPERFLYKKSYFRRRCLKSTRI